MHDGLGATWPNREAGTAMRGDAVCLRLVRCEVLETGEWALEPPKPALNGVEGERDGEMSFTYNLASTGYSC
jgi:hypothetical protein